MSESIGVVIPAYNPDIDRLNTYIRSLQNLSLVDKIHLELDAPSDATVRVLKEPDSINIVQARRGKGTAITAGFDTLSTDVLAFADADGATPAESFGDIIQSVKSGETGIAVGSRRHPDADIRTHQTILRRRMGDAFAWLARQTLPTSLYDYQCGAKVLSSQIWEEVQPHLYQEGFAWDLELIAVTSAFGYDIHEVPVVWDDASGSTVNPVRDSFSMAVAMFTIRHRIGALNGDRLSSLLHNYRNPTPVRNGQSSED